ncbi:uncharacterized protein isoform X1 [Macaca fascicularis]|uniref:uncharacterized protein isoform X1 n=1 Tax=Macaca fascicularis TaxID=9541 RepID=UPI001E258B0E|nr:uncharacterized protein LOC102145028 isoform X2 [Macaca fascicularis]
MHEKEGRTAEEHSGVSCQWLMPDRLPVGTPLAPTDPQQDVMRSEGGGVRDEVGGPPADGRKLSLCSDLRLPGSPQASDWPLLASGEENLLPERVLCSGVLPALYSVHNGNFQLSAPTMCLASSFCEGVCPVAVGKGLWCVHCPRGSHCLWAPALPGPLVPLERMPEPQLRSELCTSPSVALLGSHSPGTRYPGALCGKDAPSTLLLQLTMQKKSFSQ